jgi:hypothetical protein
MKPGNSEPAAEGWFTPDQPDRLTACGETIAVVRKKALLRILARREADRENLRPTDADVEAMSEQFRQAYGLVEGDELARWLHANALSLENYAAAMHDFAVVRLVEEFYAREIDDLVPDQIAISTARFRQANDD